MLKLGLSSHENHRALVHALPIRFLLYASEAAWGISVAEQGGVGLFSGGKLKLGDGGRKMMYAWG